MYMPHVHEHMYTVKMGKFSWLGSQNHENKQMKLFTQWCGLY